MKKNNRVYLPADALARHEDFDVWYEDGDTFLSFKGDWSSERDKVTIFGRMGGEMGRIKPDAQTLTYYLQLERWEYAFHTLRVFKDYYIEGMRWLVKGSLSNLPFHFTNEDTSKQEGHVRLVDFKNRGACYEIKTSDVAKLRIATAAIVAMGIKEEHKGKSEGLKDPNASKAQKLKRWMFEGRGLTYEQLQELEKAPEQAESLAEDAK